MNVRVKIDAPAGLVELEGDREFVSTYLDKLLPIVEAAGFGRASPRPNLANPPAAAAEPADSQDGEKAAEPAKKKRKAGKRGPAGTSTRDRINSLRADKFFAEQRTPTAIVTGLASKGWTHKHNQVTAALAHMFNAGEIQRTKAPDGPGFSYYWDRD